MEINVKCRPNKNAQSIKLADFEKLDSILQEFANKYELDITLHGFKVGR